MGVLRSEPRARPINKEMTPLGVGETWFAKLPGAHDLKVVVVDEVTERTVVLDSVRSGDEPWALDRFARIDVEFVEKVQPG